MPTQFEVRDIRSDEYAKFRPVARHVYKNMVRIHDRCGQPFRVGTLIRNGTPVKQLTLMEDKTCRQAGS